jgi:Zn-finger nucleic acid-binding protein
MTDLCARRYESEQIEVCPTCTGVYVTHAALASVAHDDRVPRSEQERRDALAAADAREPIDAANVVIRWCPDCASAMRRHTYAFSSGVVVDTCPLHGVWLDPGELQRIEAWTEGMRHGLQPEAESATPADDAAPSQLRYSGSLAALAAQLAGPRADL